MLREILYVDVTRIRSLIGQLDQGVVESVVDRSARGFASDIFSAVRMGGLWRREETAERSQTRSVEDILFVTFEEAAEAEGLLRDIDASDPVAWQSSSIHDSLAEGEIIRLTSDILILDPIFLKNRLDRFTAVIEAFDEMQRNLVESQMAAKRVQIDEMIADATRGLGRDQRKQTERELRNKSKRQLDEEVKKIGVQNTNLNLADIQSIAHMMNTFFRSDAITIRVLPCGRDQPSFSFVGSLLGRDEYIQRERDALFSRYGALISGWTAVLQVAAVSQEAEDAAARGQDFASLNFTLGETFDRAVMERASLDLLAMMDSLGISEGPRWPAVSVVPLGIYRVIPRSMKESSPAH